MFNLDSSAHSTLPPRKNRCTICNWTKASLQQKKAAPVGSPSRCPKQRTTVKSNHRIFKLLSLLVVFFSLTLPSMAGAAKVTLVWDGNDPAAEGYHMFQRTAGQGYDYSAPVWSGTTTTCTIDHLVDGTYYFVARAYQSENQSANSNEVEFKVVINQAPQADAGSDQAVSAGTPVTLDGTASTDPEGPIAAYQWTQTAGPATTLANATSATTIFTAPNVANTSTLNFNLTVSDAEGLIASDTCQVTVLPVAPQDSDNDGLTDEEETNIYGTNPNNPDSDGDGISDSQEVINGTDPLVDNSTPETDPEPQYAKIWIEAEDGDIYAPMQIADNGDASEGSYIWVPNRSGRKGYAEYTFEVQTAGEYVIWGRVLSSNGRDNSFFVSVDDNKSVLWDTLISDTWIWGQIKNRNETSPRIYNLTTGEHKLTIFQREDGTKLDKIIITSDFAMIPDD
jgi:hypothetical protein